MTSNTMEAITRNTRFFFRYASNGVAKTPPKPASMKQIPENTGSLVIPNEMILIPTKTASTPAKKA